MNVTALHPVFGLKENFKSIVMAFGKKEQLSFIPWMCSY